MLDLLPSTQGRGLEKTVRMRRELVPKIEQLGTDLEISKIVAFPYSVLGI